MVINERNIHRYLIFSIVLVLIIGLFVDILDIDSAKYASISLELLKNDDWLHVQHRNTHYTNLPPLLFWLSALSFKLLGIANFSYKFFGLAFVLLGIYSTFQLTKIYYGQRAGRIAAIILGTSQGFFYLTLDLRTDTIVLGAMIFSIWQIIEYLRNHQAKNFLLGLIGISLAMLAQGLIGLLIPIFAIGSDLVLRQKWKDVFKWQWIIGLVIIAFFLFPMIYGLDEQLKQLGANISGIHFFLIEQSFAKATTRPINNFAYIWAFLPWAILFILALADKVNNSWIHPPNKKSAKYSEHISIAGFTIAVLLLLSTKHHLPHSIYILTPFSAILTAAYIDKMKPKYHHFIHKSQTILIFVLWMLSFLLLFYIFTPVNIVIAIISILLFALSIWSLFKLPQKKALVVVTALWAISFAFIQSKHIYPRLSSYQSGAQVGKWLNEHPEESLQFSNFRTLSNTEDFYSRKSLDTKTKVNQLSSKDRFLYTDEIGLNMIKKAAIPYLIMKKYDDYNVSRLNLTFLNPQTRQNALEKRYLIAIYPKGK